jgi:Astacin (Peptidase family M12A)/Abnormal spindle-like microcephaly-assoc'd, ASPM-SPD-2-Hydin
VPRAFSRTAVSVLYLLAFCGVGGASFAQGQPPQGQPAPGQITQPTPTSSEIHMGMWRGRPVTYQVINGRNIYQGDIILENVQPMPKSGQGGGIHSDSVGLANSNYLWDKVGGVAQVPYVIDSGSSDVANIQAAIKIYNATFAGVIQFVPYVSQANYIDIDLFDSPNGSCEAEEGDAHQGEQFVNGALNCTVATILHEFGHVTGVWHEQSRTDAANYVTFNYANVIKGSIGNFLPAVDNDQQNLTPYDYASVMEYPAFSYSSNGGPPLDSIPPGMPLSNLVGYSAADVEGIMRLYGVAPTEVTVTSNPPGLQVLVDGSPVTTPMTYTWALQSTHTLAVATGVQSVNGVIVGSSDPQQPTTFYYTYGRWNNGGTQSQTITVTPGNGDAGFPVSAPQLATYTANFIQLVPFTFTVFPSGSGNVAVTGVPSGPQSYPGVSGIYFVARQQATLTATPTGSNHFYAYLNGPYYLAGGIGANPKTFYVPDTGLTVDPFTEFTSYPLYTVDVSPDAFSSNLQVSVDGGFGVVPPINFSPDPNLDGSAWKSGTMHTLDFPTPQSPFSVNTQFVFSTWNPGGTANPLSITVPATSQSYVATITPEYVPATNFNFPPCGGTAAITPASMITGGFYPSGTILTYTETPSTTTPAGQWIFTGWTWDLNGTTNPDTLSPTDESLVYANFNTATAPLTITSLSPPSAVAGSGQFVLTINGTGFTPQTGNAIEIVGFNFFTGPTFPVTFVNSMELQVTVPGSAIATPGTFLLYVENFPSNPPEGSCAVFADQPFFVSQGPGSGATTVTATPITLTFTSTTVGKTSASQTITVKNTGGTATTIAITASTNFSQSASTMPCPVAPATLAGGQTCLINATFAPTTAGNLTGNIAVTDSATNSPQIVMLSGTATAAPTTVTATPSSLAFGSQAVGTTSTGQPFTVQNTGTASTSIAIAASANYSQINNCGTLLQVGTSCTVTVTFTPTANGSLPGTIKITDSATNSPQTVTVSGTGGTGTTLTVTPASEAFASLAVGDTSAAKVITVKNTGTSSTTISVAASPNFAQTNGCPLSPATLNAGVSCTINVAFVPTTTGALTGNISVTDNATSSPQMVSLTGTGLAAVTLSPTTLAFGSESVGGTSAAKIVTMTNNLAETLSFTFSATTNYSAVAGGTTPCGSSLAAKAKCTISVTFDPTTSGSLPGQLKVSDTAFGNPQTVSLTGTGVEPVVTVTTTPATETFAAQTVNTTSAGKAVVVKNTGNTSTPLTVSAATGDFAQTNNCPTTLNAAASCTVTVTFTPLTTGTLTGSFTVADSASNSPQTVKLTGTGTAPVVITITPTSQAFTATVVQSASASKTITVKNTGTQSTSISAVSSGDFASTSNTCTGTLSGGGTCTITETFNPTVTGAISGDITITDTATNTPQIVPLSGTGLAPVTFSAALLAFPSGTVGVTSAAKTVTMTNNLSSPLTAMTLAASGSYSTSGGGTTCTSTLAATSSCTISVTFTPTANGSIDGAVTVTYGAAYSPQEVKLTGTGTGGSTSPLKFTPASLAFTSQAIGSTSAAKTVTVQNTSASTVTLSSIAPSGNFNYAASGTTPCTNTLMLVHNASCTLSVTFSPSIAGAIQGALVISDTGTGIDQQVVNLTGTAVNQVTFSPVSLTFTSEAVGGTSLPQTVTLTNNSPTASLTLSPLVASGDFAIASGGTCGTSVAANSTCTFHVTFSPNKTGSITGAITVTDNASNSPQVVKLTGTGSS